MDREKEIIAMLDGELDIEKISDITTAIEENKDLLEDKLIYEKLIQCIKEEGKSELREELDGYLKEYLEEKPKSLWFKLSHKPITYLSIAASLFFGLFFINFYNQEKEEPIILKRSDTPIKSDSAIYNMDSVNISTKKNIE